MRTTAFAIAARGDGASPFALARCCSRSTCRLPRRGLCGGGDECLASHVLTAILSACRASPEGAVLQSSPRLAAGRSYVAGDLVAGERDGRRRVVVRGGCRLVVGRQVARVE